jgi:hypothetical protein
MASPEDRDTSEHEWEQTPTGQKRRNSMPEAKGAKKKGRRAQKKVLGESDKQ